MQKLLFVTLFLLGCDDRTCVHSHREHVDGYTDIEHHTVTHYDSRGRVTGSTRVPMPVYHAPYDHDVCDTWMVCTTDKSGTKICNREGDWVR